MQWQNTVSRGRHRHWGPGIGKKENPVWATPAGRRQEDQETDCIPRAVESCENDPRAGAGVHMPSGGGGGEGREDGHGEAGPVVTTEPQWEVAPAVAPDSTCLFSSNAEPAECLSSKCLSPSLPPRTPRMYCLSSSSRCSLLH